jgi:hypothetical protein
MTKQRCNLGLEGRQFLMEVEWMTYRRRKPVRYIRKKKDLKCGVCGQPETADNPFQNAHIIGFDLGVIDLALCPEFLDSDANIVTAHKKRCNRASELDLPRSMRRLKGLGVNELPSFLPPPIHEMWRAVTEVQGQNEVPVADVVVNEDDLR